MARKPPLTPASADGTTGATRASAVYEQLRDDITRGVLEPGSKLRVGAISERYGVGASPLREALSRLSAEGLVARTDQRGFSVAALNWDELPVLTRNRVQLESLALAESIEHRDAAWEDQLALLVHRLSRTPAFTGGRPLCAQPRLGSPAPRLSPQPAGALPVPLAAGLLRQPGRRGLPIPPAGRWPGVQLPQRACRARGHL
jgi:DNA-binding transcriptional MocR family regulator